MITPIETLHSVLKPSEPGAPDMLFALVMTTDGDETEVELESFVRMKMIPLPLREQVSASVRGITVEEYRVQAEKFRQETLSRLGYEELTKRSEQ
jgi:hypothetical protein